jgi:hypothetical protein
MPSKSKEDVARNKKITQARNVEHVRRRRAETVCERCGAQPIEWHSDSHVGNRRCQVSNLASGSFSIARIDAEISKCEALCRSCHMKTDGRLNRLHASLAEARASRLETTNG